ncbi:arylsulfatase B-like isoform X2 [Littorina saxatilis]|uniref:Sulfatase N-terminal domain-containing protein n=2 Tax=Littorina saxatilis TaxID=31220 RepID=A0AAN9AZ79_9CAEN
MTWTTVTLLVLCGVAVTSGAKPNIIFAMLDDAGWYDFQSHDPLMATPRIDQLRQEGLFLDNSYVLPMCAPTRAALLTGRYPHTMGAQDGNAAGTKKLFWPNETFSMLPGELKGLGYKTHMLGKWHLGFCHPSVTPLGRGFDTFHGMLLGSHLSYYTHTKGNANGPYDWWNNTQPDLDAKDTYNTELINDAMVDIVQQSQADQPFFVYMAFAAPHGPFEVPQHYVDTYCSHVTEPARRIHCAMMAAVDEGIGRMIDALKAKGIYDNTAIVVTSDNGGPVGSSNPSGSYNYPLRGGKKTVYEGGTRAYTVVKAPGLTVTNATWSGMINAVDWMPTLLHMAGGNAKDWMHGINAWNKIKKFGVSARKEMLYTYDDYFKFNHCAYRMGRWKLIQGRPGFHQGWYVPQNLVDAGVAENTPLAGNQDFTHFELYNLHKDPEERKDLAAKKLEIVQEIVGKIEALLDLYPLQPFVESEQSDSWTTSVDGVKVLSTCWCHPENSADTPDCTAA